MWLSTMINVGRSVVFWKDVKCPCQHFQIVGIGHARHIPSIADKARRHIFTEGPTGGPIEGDRIVVVDPAEIRELQMSGERSRFAADTFHQVAVGAHRIDVEVEDLQIPAG